MPSPSPPGQRHVTGIDMSSTAGAALTYTHPIHGNASPTGVSFASLHSSPRTRNMIGRYKNSEDGMEKTKTAGEAPERELGSCDDGGFVLNTRRPYMLGPETTVFLVSTACTRSGGSLCVCQEGCVDKTIDLESFGCARWPNLYCACMCNRGNLRMLCENVCR